MFEQILTVLWLFLPATLANSFPVLIAKVPFLKPYNYPMDFHKTWKGKRILGSHKTFRGLIAGVTGAILVALIQQNWYEDSVYLQEHVLFDYASLSPYVLGVALGLGTILGDATKSFFKRRVGIKPGAPWIPFDQIDFILGGIIFTLPIFQLELIYYLLLFPVFITGHVLSNIIGYLIGVKDVPY